MTMQYVAHNNYRDKQNNLKQNKNKNKKAKIKRVCIQ